MASLSEDTLLYGTPSFPVGSATSVILRLCKPSWPTISTPLWAAIRGRSTPGMLSTRFSKRTGKHTTFRASHAFTDKLTRSFRNSVFYRLMGEQFIDFAFKTARAADPNAKLYINDYNLDGPGSKVNAMVALIGRLKSRGVPIDGVGTQAHLILGQVGGVAAQLAVLANTGLDVAITELDIRIAKTVDSTKLAQQQTDYNTVTKACLNVSKCVGITVWGVSDKVG